MLSFLADQLGEFLLDPSGVIDDVRDRRRERRSRQRAMAAGIPSALRVVDGAHPGLSRRWTRGAASVPPGALVFEPGGKWRRRLTIPVRSAALHQPGDTSRRSPRAIGPQPRRIVLTTAQATLEWLVPQEQVERAMGVTRRRARGARPPTG